MSVILGGVLELLFLVYMFSFFSFLQRSMYLAFYFSTCVKSALRRVKSDLGNLVFTTRTVFQNS